MRRPWECGRGERVMNRILLVTLRWVETPLNADRIDATLATCGDWLRWNGWTWMVSTTLPQSEVRARVLQQLTPQDSLIIAEVNSTSGFEGWAPQWVWTWLSQHADPNYTPQSTPAPQVPAPYPPRPPAPSEYKQPTGLLGSLFDPDRHR